MSGPKCELVGGKNSRPYPSQTPSWLKSRQPGGRRLTLRKQVTHTHINTPTHINTHFQVKKGRRGRGNFAPLYIFYIFYILYLLFLLSSIYTTLLVHLYIPGLHCFLFCIPPPTLCSMFCIRCLLIWGFLLPLVGGQLLQLPSDVHLAIFSY